VCVRVLVKGWHAEWGTAGTARNLDLNHMQPRTAIQLRRYNNQQ